VDAVRIVFTGLRPGEKLFEELLADADATIATAVPQLRIARLESRESSVSDLLQRLAGPLTLDDAEVREALTKVVLEYKPA